MIAFLDSSALIYLIEAAEPFAGKIRNALQPLLAADPRLRTAVGRLTFLECRVGPLRDEDHQTLAAYDAFFTRPDLIVVELDAKVVNLAAAIRARHGLKTPDALQAACCLQLGANHMFLTGAKGFRRVPELNVHVLG